MITSKRLIPGSVLTGSDVTYYTSPALTVTTIKKLVLNNTTGAPVACTVNIPNSGSVAASNCVWQGTVPDGTSMEIYWAEGQVLEAGGFISAKGSGVTIISSGLVQK